jgi:hypothetical protein
VKNVDLYDIANITANSLAMFFFHCSIEPFCLCSLTASASVYVPILICHAEVNVDELMGSVIFNSGISLNVSAFKCTTRVCLFCLCLISVLTSQTPLLLPVLPAFLNCVEFQVLFYTVLNV